MKRIEVLPGRRLSLQRHHQRAEHWVAHRMANVGNELLVFIEVQRGDYLGESDIERFDDDFGRADT